MTWFVSDSELGNFWLGSEKQLQVPPLCCAAAGMTVCIGGRTVEWDCCMVGDSVVGKILFSAEARGRHFVQANFRPIRERLSSLLRFPGRCCLSNCGQGSTVLAGASIPGAKCEAPFGKLRAG